jgi:hypothetical protein
MLPIVEAARTGMRTTIWGQIRPGTRQRLYQLQRLLPSGWTPVGGASAVTDGTGSYTRVVYAPKGARFRVVSLDTGTSSRPITIH